MRKAAVASAVLLAAFACAGAARAQDKPVSKSTEYSPYEKEAIKDAVDQLHAEIDPAPEGKIIERIDIVRLDVIEDRDVHFLACLHGAEDLVGAAKCDRPDVAAASDVRKLANAIHYTTRDSIIRREMLLGVGDRWEQVTIDEIARNLRARMPVQVSLVIIVPVRGSAPGKVGAVVITKDIWSLRVSYGLSVTPGGLEDLLLVPQETNLLGLQHTLSTRFRYQPESYTLGVGYSVPRFGTSWIGASASANIFINRRSNSPEGSSMSASVGQPLYSTRTEWAWSGSAGYTVGVSRLYSNAAVAGFSFDPTPPPPVRGAKDPLPGDETLIPVQYRTSTVTASIGATRSFGWALKNNFNLSLNASRSAVRGIGLDALDPRAVDAFRTRFFPVGEDRVYPSLTWATFRNDYLRTLDIGTLALQEDYRLGHDVSVTVYPVLSAIGSTRDLVGVTARAGYAIPVSDGFIGASVSTVAEEDLGQSTVTDANVGASFTAVTPRIGFGRIVMSTSFLNRYRNYLNGLTTTGGGDRLRGYPSNFFIGKDAYFYNIEFRSTSKRVLFSEVGAVAFYDAGDAATGFDNLTPKQSVGAGLRVLFPQVNRLVTRFDVALPLNRGPFPNTATCSATTDAAARARCQPVDPVGFNITVDQAF